MTPKEKAEELLKKMDVIHYIKLGGKNSESKGLPVSMHNSQIKQCALIAVNEIIDALLHHAWQNRNEIEFYQEVKQEIEKL
jgi:hypothetical protein